MKNSGEETFMKRGHIFHKVRGILFLSVLFLLWGNIYCFPSPVFGGDNTWSSNGPSGARILSLAIDPNSVSTIYAGSQDVYKSTDGGSSWQSTGLLKNVFVQSLAVEPGNSNNIYAGTSGGIYKSTDAGSTWSLAGLSTSISVNSLVIDPSTTSILYAGTSGGIYKSTDSGASWSLGTLVPTQINALAIDPNTTSIIYAATTTLGVYKSTNSGSSWAAINTSLPSNPYPSIISLAIDSTTSTTIYAGTDGKGVYKSTNSGSSWTAINTGLPTNATVYSLGMASSSIIYAGTSGAGVYKSTDSGSNWTAINTGLPSSTTSIRKLAINPSTTSTVYTGTDGSGVYKSTDSGANWAASNSGIPTQSNISSVVIDPKTPQTLYATGSISVGTGSSASTINAIFKSTDSGSNWTTITNGIPTTTTILSLAINPSTTSILYAGTSGSGIYKSTDSGASWTALTNGIFSNTTLYTMAIHPTDSNIIYAGGYYVLNSINISIIYKSTDGGTTWSSSNTGIPQAGLVYALAIDPKTPTTLYVGTASGVYKSTDSGSNWSASNSGIDSGDYVYSLAIDPKTPSIIYAGTGNSAKTGSGEVMKSTNSGATWIATGSQMGSTVINALAIDPNTTSTIYAGTLTGGIFMSQNGGDSWLGINSSLGSAGSVNAVVINPTDTTILHIGTATGVYGFTFKNRSPNTPSSPSPSHGATVTSALTTLSWTGGDPDPWDTVTYDVYWDGPGNNSDPPRWATSHPATTIDVSPLQKTSTDYYWKVVARDNHGATTTSAIWKFTTAATLTNNPPNTPTNPTPGDGATNQAINSTLNWTGGDPDTGDTVTYAIYFGTSANPSKVASTTNTSYDPGTLSTSTTYSWYIIADDGRGSTTTGPLWRFTTGAATNNAPNTPSSPSPADGTTEVSITPTLNWSGGDPDTGDTVTYAIYFGTDSSNLLLKASDLSTTNYNPGTLNYSTTYYWQVKATDSRGATKAGPVWSLMTVKSPTAPNNPPIAKAGLDSTVFTGSATTLDGSGSSDPEGDTLTYNWSFIAQPQDSKAPIYDSTSPKATIIPDVDGTYKIRLAVSDGTANSTDTIKLVSLGKDYKIVIATDKENYTSGDTVNFYVWVGNPASGSEIKADAFMGLGLPDGSLLFFDPAMKLTGSNVKDPSTFTAFVQKATLSPGLIFPATQEVNTDTDGNGKLDSYKLYSTLVTPLVPKGQYFAFAALAQPGSVQSGNPQIIGTISLAIFNFNP